MNKIIQENGFILRAAVTPVDTSDLSDTFRLAFTSQWTGRHHPLEPCTEFSTILERAELTKLRDILTLHLDTLPC